MSKMNAAEQAAFLLGLSATLDSLFGFFPRHTTREPPEDPIMRLPLEKEYELIQQKKSSLSAKDRSKVVRIIEKRKAEQA